MSTGARAQELRVLIVTDQYEPMVGGVPTVTRDLARGLAGRLTDEHVRVAAAGVRRLYHDWAALPVGGTLRATWPLHDSWLRLL